MASRNGDEVARKIITEAMENNSDTIVLQYLGYGQLPELLRKMKGLRHLHLNEYYTDLPAWLCELEHLETLDVCAAENVAPLLPHLHKLKRLRKLRLALVEGMDDLPMSLARLENLEELNVDSAFFRVFPPAIEHIKSLKSFSWQDCECGQEEVFASLSRLPELKKIRLTFYSDDEQIDSLSDDIRKLRLLEEMDLSEWHELRKLPDCIGELENLKVLNLSNEDKDFERDLEELPESLCELPRLESLDVYGLQNLKSLPRNFGRLANLKHLDIRHSGVRELNLEPAQMRNLESLHMYGALPDIGQCENLKELSWGRHAAPELHGNIVPDIPEPFDISFISRLKKLEYLCLTSGKMESTDFLADLPNLRFLSLACDFERFPAGLEKLEKLEEISVWGAVGLREIPESLAKLPALKRLQFDGCGFEYLPKTLTERKDLEISVRFCPARRGRP